MARHRKVDRALLSQNDPLDSADQELIISLLAAQNDSNFQFYRRVLLLAIVVEILPLAHAARVTFTQKGVYSPLAIMMVILSCVFLVATMWPVWRDWRRKALDYTNMALVAGLWTILYRSGLCWQDVFALVPAANLGAVVLLRRWHISTNKSVHDLRDLTYKFKSV